MYNFFALFSFSYIVFLNLVLISFIIYSSHKKKKALQQLEKTLNNYGGYNNEIKKNS